MKEKKISGKELAEGANTTEATISRYVSGKRSPEILEVLKNAAKFLGVSADYLLGLTNNPFEKGSPARGSKRIARPIYSGERRGQKNYLGGFREICFGENLKIIYYKSVSKN